MGSLKSSDVEIVLLNQNDLINNSNEKIYLDYNGTTPYAEEVIKSITDSLNDNWFNPSSKYQEGINAKKKIEESRQLLANMINADSASDILFLSGGTEANNLVFHSLIKYYDSLKRNALEQNMSINNLPHIIISRIEHDSVKLVAENYEKDNLAQLTIVEVNKHGVIDVESVIDSIRPNTILISIMLANNETGVIQPVKELMNKINSLGYNQHSFNNNKSNRSCPLFVHTDAAQAIGKIKVDVNELQVDYLTIVGHKFYGPRIGCLYARNFQKKDHIGIEFDLDNNRNNKKAPLKHMFYGAGQENGFRPGTENTCMIIGLGKAAELVINNLEKYSSHMKEMRDYLEKRLEEEFGIENLHFNGRSNKSERLPNTCNVSFTGNDEFKGWVILSNAKLLEASTGACCHAGDLRPSKILLAMQIDKCVASNALRLTIGRETTKTQIDIVVQDIKQALDRISS